MDNRFFLTVYRHAFHNFNNLIHINFKYCQYQINQIGDFKVPDKNLLYLYLGIKNNLQKKKFKLMSILYSLLEN